MLLLLCFARDFAKIGNTHIFKLELQIAISQQPLHQITSNLKSGPFDTLSRCLPTYSPYFCIFSKSNFRWGRGEHQASKDSSTCKAAGNALGISRYVL